MSEKQSCAVRWFGMVRFLLGSDRLRLCHFRHIATSAQKFGFGSLRRSAPCITAAGARPKLQQHTISAQRLQGLFDFCPIEGKLLWHTATIGVR